ncbi:iron chelate uptake ABC transporter family permease subunit, partial [Bacillus altitudinis]|uniref:iron chelate uptake ABC transporter family permease subunit n=1 Tax=Bacillus altitudinis TaxID=293387 RepID=UPI0011AB01A6
FLILVLLRVVGFGLFIVRVCMGRGFIGRRDVVVDMLGEGEGNRFVLNRLRIGRRVVGVLVGGGVVVWGVILEGVIRNPVGWREMIGIRRGGWFGGIMLMVFWM